MMNEHLNEHLKDLEVDADAHKEDKGLLQCQGHLVELCILPLFAYLLNCNEDLISRKVAHCQ